MSRFPSIHGTTILADRQGGHAAFAGDGQVTPGRTVMKHTARKIRSTADAISPRWPATRT